MGGKGSGEASKTREGYRGWILMKSGIDQALKAVLTGFATMKVKGQYPASIYWPDINDWEGMKGFIDAVMAKDIVLMETIQKEFPEYDLGINEFVERLKREGFDKFPGGCKIIRTQPLPRNMRIDTEIVTDKDNVMHIRNVIRRRSEEIAVKILASCPATPQRLKVAYG